MNKQTEDTSKYLSQDEISITDLIMKCWQRRGLIVVLPIVFLLLAVTFLLFTVVKTQQPTVFFVQLQGINNSAYPNGASFSPQDLLAPEVLSRAASQLKLPVDDDLREAIQVEYGVPTTVGIQRKYQAKLADKKLTAVDIETINNAYQKELVNISEGGLRITINHASIGLSSAQGAVLANALPRAWTKVYTQKYRVLIDTTLTGVSVINRDNPLVTSSDILAARITLDKIKAGLDSLNNDNRLKAIVSDGGFSSSDLQSMFQNFDELYFRTLFAGLFVSPDTAANTFKIELGLKIDEIDSNIEELNHSLEDLQNFRVQASPGQAGNGTSDTVQFGDSSFKQLVELANQASLSDYLRQTLNDRRELIRVKSSLQTELNRSKGEFKVSDKEGFVTDARLKFSILKNEYVSLLNSARKLRQQAYGDFYQPLGSPDVVGSFLPRQSILVLLLSVMLGGMLGVILALVMPSRRG